MWSCEIVWHAYHYSRGLHSFDGRGDATDEATARHWHYHHVSQRHLLHDVDAQCTLPRHNQLVVIPAQNVTLFHRGNSVSRTAAQTPRQ